jgi:hypothetical protein
LIILGDDGMNILHVLKTYYAKKLQQLKNIRSLTIVPVGHRLLVQGIEKFSTNRNVIL